MPINLKLQLDEYSLVTTRLMKKHAATSEETADSDELRNGTAQLALILDLAHQAFAGHEPAALTVERLAGRLHKLRRQVAPAVWQQLIPLARQHRVAEYLIQDPFTRWSVEKPR
ncbi:MAG: class I SAM-dependent methyltransferase, partial [Mesorhizobium sp.]